MTDLEAREAIAALPGNIGFVELIKVLETLVTEATILVVNADTEQQTLKAARNLQALFKYFNILKTVPHQIMNEFEEEKKLILEGGGDPLFPIHRRDLLKQIENNLAPDWGNQ